MTASARRSTVLSAAAGLAAGIVSAVLAVRVGSSRAAEAVPERPPAPLASVPPPVSDPEALKRLEQTALTEYQARVQQHYTGRKDLSWAPAAEASLGEDFERAATAGGFRVVRTDCRTASCAVVLEWEDYAKAEAGFVAASHSRRRLPCGHTVFLPPPADPSRPYRATMLFDCARPDAMPHAPA